MLHLINDFVYDTFHLHCIQAVVKMIIIPFAPDRIVSVFQNMWHYTSENESALSIMCKTSLAFKKEVQLANIIVSPYAKSQRNVILKQCKQGMHFYIQKKTFWLDRKWNVHSDIIYIIWVSVFVQNVI